MQKIIACYHGGCSDGTSAAWVLQKRYPNAEFHGIRPSETDFSCIDFEGAIVFFLDVSPANFDEILPKAEHVFLYDHHATTKKLVESVGTNEKLSVVFDTKRCGCLITWDELFPGEERPWFLEYVDDRDRWQWKLQNSREINEAIYSQGWMERLDELWNTEKELLIASGRELLQIKERHINDAIRVAVPVKFCGYEIWLCQAKWQLRSEVGNRLCSVLLPNGKIPSFSAIWKHDEETGEIWASLRGEKNSPCLATLCEKFGGGGHPKAAGFTIESAEEFEKIFEIIWTNYFTEETLWMFFIFEMSLEQVLDETLDIWMDAFDEEISDKRNGAKILEGLRYSLALVRREDVARRKRKYEKAHGVFRTTPKKLAKLCESRERGFLTFNETTRACVGYDPEERKTKKRMKRYRELSEKKKELLETFLSYAPSNRPVFWDCKDKLWFTYDKNCYGDGKGKYITVKRGKPSLTHSKGPLKVKFWDGEISQSGGLCDCIDKIL
ncbi:DHH phosphoesterase [Tokyovirus A1]|uniref:DHH phosphoesterase n=1 Tax=Tokyovirus A1 TaxID=1826170 RepID=UPI0007A986F5|nr:DHH phosphoesterase [Tokyovirus A1]BAU80043.1 conserved putative DHH superfamily phosphohydrolase [Tokyovirus A1]